MNMASKIGFCSAWLGFLLLVLPSYAQQPATNLHFFDRTIDLGHISEDGGEVRKSVEAVNRGCDTLYILEVLTTCGCTTANYTQRELFPGDTLRLDLNFDPMNRPGRIDKSIHISVSDSSDPLRLQMVGYVQPRERSVDEIYPFDMGDGFRLKSNFHSFSYLEHGKVLEERVGYINTSDGELHIGLHPQSMSGYLQVLIPKTVAPHASGDIILRYELAEECAVYGILDDVFTFVVNGETSYYPFSCQAIAVDNFDMIDDISAPRADISKKIIKFGDVKRCYAILEQSVELLNVGSSPLMLRAVASTSKALSVEQKALEVAVGGSATIVVRLDVSKIEDWDNPFVARLMLITNDPMRPMLSLKVNALPM